MTPIEKKILVSLIFFLMIGMGIRIVRSHHSKIDFEVIPSNEISKEEEKFETARLKFLKVDLNLAQVKDFERLPGVGVTLARAIVDYREQKGLFKKVEDILLVKGVGKGRYNKLRQYLHVSGRHGKDPAIVK